MKKQIPVTLTHYPASQGGPLSISIIGSKFNLTPSDNIQVSLQGFDSNTLRVEYYVNGNKVVEVNNPNFGYTFSVAQLKNLDPENEIKVIEYKCHNKDKNNCQQPAYNGFICYWLFHL